jgi:outer membrane immunogenic protein
MRRTAWAYSAVGTASLLVVWTVPAEAQLYDWTGPFVGASMGVVNGDGSVPLTYPDGVPGTGRVYFDDDVPIFGDAFGPTNPIAFPDLAHLATSGYLGSANLGYDLQQGTLVYGGEVDASFFGTRSSWTTGTVSDTANNRTHGLTVSGGVDQLYSARSRIGVALDRLLLFGTGGLAVGHADLDTVAYLDNGYGPGRADWSGRASAWRLGFMVGGGAEYAISDHLSLKIEGLYYDLGTASAKAGGTGTYGGAAVNVSSYDATLNLSGVIVRGGFNLRF